MGRGGAGRRNPGSYLKIYKIYRNTEEKDVARPKVLTDLDAAYAAKGEETCSVRKNRRTGSMSYSEYV